MAYWGLLTFVIGLLYGWLKPGRQDKWNMLKMGALIGIVLALALALLAFASNQGALFGVSGIFGVFLEVVIFTLLFILGVWVGDLVEGARKHA